MPSSNEHIDVLFALTREEIEQYTKLMQAVEAGNHQAIITRIKIPSLSRFFQGEVWGIQSPLEYLLLIHGGEVSIGIFKTLCEEYCKWFNTLAVKQINFHQINIVELTLKTFVPLLAAHKNKLDTLISVIVDNFEKYNINIKTFLQGMNHEEIRMIGNQDLIKILNITNVDLNLNADKENVAASANIGQQAAKLIPHLIPLMMNLQKEDEVSDQDISSFVDLLSRYFYLVNMPSSLIERDNNMLIHVLKALKKLLDGDKIKNPANLKKLQALFYESVIVIANNDPYDGSLEFLTPLFKEALSLLGDAMVTGNHFEYQTNKKLMSHLYRILNTRVHLFISGKFSGEVDNADVTLQDFKDLVAKLSDKAENNPLLLVFSRMLNEPMAYVDLFLAQKFPKKIDRKKQLLESALDKYVNMMEVSRASPTLLYNFCLAHFQLLEIQDEYAVAEHNKFWDFFQAHEAIFPRKTCLHGKFAEHQERLTKEQSSKKRSTTAAVANKVEGPAAVTQEPEQTSIVYQDLLEVMGIAAPKVAQNTDADNEIYVDWLKGFARSNSLNAEYTRTIAPAPQLSPEALDKEKIRTELSHLSINANTPIVRLNMGFDSTHKYYAVWRLNTDDFATKGNFDQFLGYFNSGEVHYNRKAVGIVYDFSAKIFRLKDKNDDRAHSRIEEIEGMRVVVFSKIYDHNDYQRKNTLPIPRISPREITRASASSSGPAPQNMQTQYRA